MEKKAPKLALVVGTKPKDEAEDYEDSYEELAEILGVAPDKSEEFAEAFKAAVMACK